MTAANPDVVLGLIDALEALQDQLDMQAGSIEAVQAANQRLAAELTQERTYYTSKCAELERLNLLLKDTVKVYEQTLAAKCAAPKEQT